MRRDARGGGHTGTDWRAEAAVRAFDIWFGGGIMARDSARLVAPAVPARIRGDDGAGRARCVRDGPGTAVGVVQMDLLGEAWQDSTRSYRPRYSTRADLFIRSNFLGRFPTGNFGLYALMRHEYRSATYFPTAASFERTSGHRVLTGLLEIRILDATVTYQFRNLLGTRFQSVPGYQMPRQTQFYGVRWTFWN